MFFGIKIVRIECCLREKELSGSYKSLKRSARSRQGRTSMAYTNNAVRFQTNYIYHRQNLVNGKRKTSKQFPELQNKRYATCVAFVFWLFAES